ncbi:MAG: GNAT family N-acetyltransferase [Thermoplasmata archaeon]|nr:GNAT family N-acetyltransferase [Thermoplasmata archaeon]
MPDAESVRVQPRSEPRFRPPVTLVGRYVELVPLSPDHALSLAKAGAEPSVWEFMVVKPATDLSAMRSAIEWLLERQSKGTDLPFTVLDRSSGRAIGMTRFLEIERSDRAVEIGGTWYDPRFWRSPINTESKRLMLEHAFDVEKVNRVQLRTDVLNLRSQRAIERLGAVREGVLRDHRVVWNGRVRSSVVYSILRGEWPSVRDRLDSFLARPWTPGTGGSAV